MKFSNLFENLPSELAEEDFSALTSGGRFRLQRIVSHGQSTPPGQWYDQRQSEWVVLLRDAAGIRIEGEAEVRRLEPGDWIELPAGLRHRVEWTAPAEPTVWLALHYDDET